MGVGRPISSFNELVLETSEVSRKSTVRDEYIAKKYYLPRRLRGMWSKTVRGDTHKINEMLIKVRKYYEEGSLTGISYIQVSTRRISSRASVCFIGFICGPYYDKNSVLDYGQNIVNKICGHTKPYDSFFYNSLKKIGGKKSGYFVYYNLEFSSQLGREENAGAGTSSSEDDHGVGTTLLNLVRSEDASVESYDTARTSMSPRDPILPSSVTKERYIKMIDLDIFLKYKCSVRKRGMWMMFVEWDQLDRMWLRTCEHYAERTLTGIKYVKASTKMNDVNFKASTKMNKKKCKASSPTKKNEKKYPRAVINFFCGPCDEEDLVKEYGRNLLRIFSDYKSPTGDILYWSPYKVQGEGEKKVLEYRLPVPPSQSGAGTSGPEDNSGAGTSGPEDNSGAGTSGSEDNSGAGTSFCLKLCILGAVLGIFYVYKFRRCMSYKI